MKNITNKGSDMVGEMVESVEQEIERLSTAGNMKSEYIEASLQFFEQNPRFLIEKLPDYVVKAMKTELKTQNIVEKGSTLSEIAAKFDMTVDEFMSILDEVLSEKDPLLRNNSVNILMPEPEKLRRDYGFYSKDVKTLRLRNTWDLFFMSPVDFDKAKHTFWYMTKEGRIINQHGIYFEDYVGIVGKRKTDGVEFLNYTRFAYNYD